MPYAPVDIPGVPGEVSTEYSFWKGHSFVVAGEPVKPQGFLRKRLTLPGATGPVEATVKGGLVRPYPLLVVDGQEYPTGPATPKVQHILALLPLLLLVLVQGIFGIAIAVGSVATNMGIIRSERSDGAKIGLMLAVLLAATVVDIVLLLAATSVSNA